jgi:hypothetical protein
VIDGEARGRTLRYMLLKKMRTRQNLEGLKAVMQWDQMMNPVPFRQMLVDSL